MSWLALWMACTPAPLEVEARVVEGGLDVVASAPLDRVVATDEAGTPLGARTPPVPEATVFLPVPLGPGATVRVRGRSGERIADVTARSDEVGPVRVQIDAPVGQSRRTVRDGAEIPVLLIGDGAVRAQLVVTALEPTTATLRLGDATRRASLVVGASATLETRIDAPGRVPFAVGAPDASVAGRLAVDRVSLDEARAGLALATAVLPTDAEGRRDRSRPPDRVTLPAHWWRRLLRALGLGYRARDDQMPWCWEAVTLQNHRDEAVNVVVRAEVVGSDGPAWAFRPRIREQDGDTHAVSVLLRVPPQRAATAVLPLYADGAALAASARFTRRVTVVPLGASQPLHVHERPLYVSRGSTWASLGFVLAMGTTLLGTGLLVLRIRTWLAQARTRELVTIALFGSITFVVGAAFQVLGMGVATVLGPFAPLVTGLADDAFRACLLGTLLVLLPRPGIAALATVVGFVMRGLALGSFHPVDLLYLGSAVFWLESMAWVVGVTRVTGWWDASGRLGRWLRLGLALGFANVGAAATSLVVSVVLYRLYYAGWYVALILGLPGFVYVLLGCWIAVDFAAALREVES